MKKLWNGLCIKWVLISEIVGVLSGLISITGMEGYEKLIVKAPLTPPGWVFAFVWTILYALMGIGVCLVLKKGEGNRVFRCVNLFVSQLIVNFFWSPIFFNTFAFGFSLIWILVLWVLVICMTLCFSKISRLAAWLQLPYLLWLSFAIYLNGAVWQLNL